METKYSLDKKYRISQRFPINSYVRWHVIGLCDSSVFIEVTPSVSKWIRKVFYVDELTEIKLIDEDVRGDVQGYVDRSWEAVIRFCNENGISVESVIIR